MLDKAIKYDTDKPRTDLLPATSLVEISKVFTFGAVKYSPHNYLQGDGLKYSRLIGALLRHIFAFMSGEDFDKESKMHHLAHAGCCLLMLMETVRVHPENDDRQIRFLDKIKSNEDVQISYEPAKVLCNMKEVINEQRTV